MCSVLRRMVTAPPRRYTRNRGCGSADQQSRGQASAIGALQCDEIQARRECVCGQFETAASVVLHMERLRAACVAGLLVMMSIALFNDVVGS